MYDNGVGDHQDNAETAKLSRLDAVQGDADAQFYLGVMYSNGEGVPQDYAEAVKWYRLAAEQGDASAQNNLGVMHGSGKGVPQDHVMAHMWYNIAAANGVEDASKWRDEIAAKMTSADISKAQAMARECMSSGYKNCAASLAVTEQTLSGGQLQGIIEAVSRNWNKSIVVGLENYENVTVVLEVAVASSGMIIADSIKPVTPVNPTGDFLIAYDAARRSVLRAEVIPLPYGYYPNGVRLVLTFDPALNEVGLN